MKFVPQLQTVLTNSDFSEIDRAVCVLWAYEQDGQSEGLSTSEIANHLFDLGFAKPNATRLKTRLRDSKFTKRGSKQGLFCINASRAKELNEKYLPHFNAKIDPKKEVVIASTEVPSNVRPLVSVVWQINKSYEQKIFDGCAVMMRRLVEMLLIEIYSQCGRQSEIVDSDGNFKMLDAMIKHAISDTNLKLSRNSKKFLPVVKALGDTAAHHRTYTTKEDDISKHIHSFRALISDLINHCEKFSV